MMMMIYAAHFGESCAGRKGRILCNKNIFLLL